MWTKEKTSYGDHIRVNRGMYYHHGIYVTDLHVIHFASITPGHEMDPNEASIIDTTLEQFLKGGECEKRIYTEEEEKSKRSPQEIVSYAYSRLGDKGYNVVSNNCEHFANECVFGRKQSEQVNKVIDFLSQFINTTK